MDAFFMGWTGHAVQPFPLPRLVLHSTEIQQMVSSKPGVIVVDKRNLVKSREAYKKILATVIADSLAVHHNCC